MKTLRIAAAFVARDFRVALSYRVPFVLEALGVVFTLISFSFIAKLVGDHGNAIASGDYFSFAAVGIAAASALYRAVSAPVSAARQEQVQGSLEALAAQPLSTGQLALGLAIYPALSGMGEALLLLIVAALGFSVPFGVAQIGIAIPVLALTCFAFASLGLAAAAFVVVFQQGAFTVSWAMGVLTLISGAAFPVALLPGWVQAIAEASPLTHALRALRGILLERGGAHMGSDVAVIAIFAVVLFALGLSLLHAALGRARHIGSLAQY